jgi:hypothetical protein
MAQNRKEFQVAEQDKKELDPKNLEISDLGDADLEDVSGGGGIAPELQDTANNCPIQNYNC